MIQTAFDLEGSAIIRVIDFETTGLPDDEGAEIVEIGSVDLMADTMTIENPRQTLVKPKRPITPKTMAVHHITNDMVTDAPSIGQTIGMLTAGLSENDLFCAHNIKMERHFFPGGNRRWICTLKAAQSIWPDFESHSNQAVRYELGIDIPEAQSQPVHRALPDAFVTACILRECLHHHTVEELVNITKKPTLIKMVRFGKHRGKTFEELAKSDRGYLEWMAKQDFDEDVAFTVKHWLRATQ